ncbi:MAG: holin [Clostridiales bacterium]|nr:holin [Clostridiales bacterium]
MYIAAAALYVLGVFLKAVPKIPNWVIPFILTAAGVAFGLLLIGGAGGVLQGILAAGLAVLVNQGYKQVKEQVSKTE